MGIMLINASFAVQMVNVCMGIVGYTTAMYMLTPCVLRRCE